MVTNKSLVYRLRTWSIESRCLAPSQGGTPFHWRRLFGIEDGSPDIILEYERDRILSDIHKLRNGGVPVVGTHMDDTEDLRKNYQFVLFPDSMEDGFIPRSTKARKRLE